MHRFQPFHPNMNHDERDDSEHAEATINQLPAERNATYWAAEKRQCQKHHASDHRPVNNPNVTNRVTERAEERGRNDDVSKGQPIGSVGDKREMFRVVLQPFSYVGKPIGQRGNVVSDKRALTEPPAQHVQLPP